MSVSILITGAGGYVGRQVAAQLSREFKVIGVDVQRPESPACEMLVADVRDTSFASILSNNNVTHVVHLASVVQSSGDHKRDYDIDVNGTRNVVEACLDSGVKHLTVTSSGAAYGYHADNPDWIDEQDPLRGNDEFPYSKHKRLVEEYLAEVRRDHPELKQLILRPGTVLGASTKNQITNLFEGKRILGIRGSDSPFVFICDEDMVEIIRKGVSESVEGIYNLAGTGAMSVAEIAKVLNKPLIALPASLIRLGLAVGHALGLTQYTPNQVNFLRYRPVLSNRRLCEEFGYTPKRDSRQTFDWFVENARARGQL